MRTEKRVPRASLRLAGPCKRKGPCAAGGLDLPPVEGVYAQSPQFNHCQRERILPLNTLHFLA